MARNLKNQYTISQTKRLNKLLQKSIREILHTIGQDVSQKLYAYTKQYWYDRYTPEDYDRTYTFLNSIRYRIVNNTVIVEYNEKDFEYKINHDGWGTHVGFDGNNFAQGMIDFIGGNGFSGSSIGSLKNPRARDTANALARTKKWVNKYLTKEVRRQLEKKLRVVIK